MATRCDVLIIGGGWYGLCLAEFFGAQGRSVVVCEREADFMQRASYANQARVHNGYHYPRSILTAVRSRNNLPLFVRDFGDCVRSSFDKIYAIPRQHSKLSAEQFRQCMRRIGAPLAPAPAAVKKLFNSDLIEDAFLVTEYVFDSVVLKRLMLDRLAPLPVALRLQTEVVGLRQIENNRIGVDCRTPSGEETFEAGAVFQCGYSRLNQPTAASGLPIVPLKHELTEMALVEVPAVLVDKGITVMDGPFFSLMPFPSTPYHTLSHVRYTPHAFWHDAPSEYRSQTEVLGAQPRQTAFPFMVRDAARYLPAAAECRHRDSLWEVKTILPRNEADDGRPILFLPHHGLRNYHVVLGGKIDNVYDVLDRIRNELVLQS